MEPATPMRPAGQGGIAHFHPGLLLVSVFFNEALELRRGWRFVNYWAIYIVLLLTTSAAMSEVIPGPVDFGQIRGLTLSTLTFLPPAVLSFAFMLWFVEHRSPAEFGVAFFRYWKQDVVQGVLIAAAMAIVYLIGAGSLSDMRIALGSASAPNVLITVALLAIAAASEELVYRGYALQILIQAIRPVPAVVTMSALFGLGHYLNPNATWMGALNTSLAGALLAIAYLRTRALWLSWGIHVGWNLATGVVLGLPVSGVSLSSIWKTRTGGPAWLTGGLFGPEGGILATIAIIAAAVFVYGATRSRSSNHQEVL